MAKQVTPFIVFYGPEGAGKTTQINLLIGKLKAKYDIQNIEVISIRDNHLLVPVVLGFLRKLGLSKSLKYGENIVVVADIERVIKDKRIWALFQLLNLLPVYFVRYYLKRRLRRKILIADRFIPDSLSTLAHFMNDPDILMTKLGRIYIRLIPHDACLIFLYASYRILVQRYKNRKSLIEPEDLIYYEILIGYKLSRLFSNVIIINTSERSINETSKIIEEFLRSQGVL